MVSIILIIDEFFSRFSSVFLPSFVSPKRKVKYPKRSSMLIPIIIYPIVPVVRFVKSMLRNLKVIVMSIAARSMNPIIPEVFISLNPFVGAFFPDLISVCGGTKGFGLKKGWFVVCVVCIGVVFVVCGFVFCAFAVMYASASLISLSGYPFDIIFCFMASKGKEVMFALKYSTNVLFTTLHFIGLEIF